VEIRLDGMSHSIFPKKNSHTFSFSHDDFKFEPYQIAFLNRWLHTPRDDGKPRVLILPLDHDDVRSVDKIPHFIDDTIKKVIYFGPNIWQKGYIFDV
jgi:hypothetical protein